MWQCHVGGCTVGGLTSTRRWATTATNAGTERVSCRSFMRDVGLANRTATSAQFHRQEGAPTPASAQSNVGNCQLIIKRRKDESLDFERH